MSVKYIRDNWRSFTSWLRSPLEDAFMKKVCNLCNEDTIRGRIFRISLSLVMMFLLTWFMITAPDSVYP